MTGPDSALCVMVHGGAGDIEVEDEAWARAGVAAAAKSAYSVLASGGSALDAIETAIRMLEDNPIFNSGAGAALTSTGDVELDAGIMDGATLHSGAVAVVKDIKNPITLARAVMEQTPHVMLAGQGASEFAKRVGLPQVANSVLITSAQKKRWEEAQRAPAQASQVGTVGAVARDHFGNLAAGTSTGGMMMKLPGRVGDSPLMGCGTYADNLTAAVSCTGHGERIIALTLARVAADLCKSGMSAVRAAEHAIALLGGYRGGEGGIIIMPSRGEPGFAFNSSKMARAYSAADGCILEAL